MSNKDKWHVFLVPTTQFNDEGTIETPKNMRVVVLVREMDGSKQCRILLDDKIIDVHKTNDGIEVLIDGQQVKHYKTQDKRDDTSYENRHNGELYVQIYELPDKSVMMRSNKYGISMVHNEAFVEIEVSKMENKKRKIELKD